jgi:hypothetical protein
MNDILKVIIMTEYKITGITKGEVANLIRGALRATAENGSGVASWATDYLAGYKETEKDEPANVVYVTR